MKENREMSSVRSRLTPRGIDLQAQASVHVHLSWRPLSHPCELFNNSQKGNADTMHFAELL